MSDYFYGRKAYEKANEVEKKMSAKRVRIDKATKIVESASGRAIGEYFTKGICFLSDGGDKISYRAEFRGKELKDVEVRFNGAAVDIVEAMDGVATITGFSPTLRGENVVAFRARVGEGSFVEVDAFVEGFVKEIEPISLDYLGEDFFGLKIGDAYSVYKSINGDLEKIYSVSGAKSASAAYSENDGSFFFLVKFLFGEDAAFLVDVERDKIDVFEPRFKFKNGAISVSNGIPTAFYVRLGKIYSCVLGSTKEKFTGLKGEEVWVCLADVGDLLVVKSATARQTAYLVEKGAVGSVSTDLGFGDRMRLGYDFYDGARILFYGGGSVVERRKTKGKFLAPRKIADAELIAESKREVVVYVDKRLKILNKEEIV